MNKDPIKNRQHVKDFRKRTKLRIIKAMGGCCQKCGYFRCEEALEMHHINPEEKEFSFGAIRSNPKTWTKIVEELRKCILLCANCHREIHNGITQLPNTYSSFDESFIEYKIDIEYKDSCPVCGKEKLKKNKFCSLNCSGKARQRINWNSIDLLTELKTKTKTKLAEELGVTESSVRKRLKKICLPGVAAACTPS